MLVVYPLYIKATISNNSGIRKVALRIKMYAITQVCVILHSAREIAPGACVESAWCLRGILVQFLFPVTRCLFSISSLYMRRYSRPELLHEKSSLMPLDTSPPHLSLSS